MLSDRDIYAEVAYNKIKINPFNEENVQPASYDVCLADRVYIFARDHNKVIDPFVVEPLGYTETLTERYKLDPGKFILASTVETVELPDNVSGRIEGKSSLARLGLIVHVTAGFIDPGFEGQITLELYNMNSSPIWLYPGMRIAQISFTYLHTRAIKPYGSDGLNSKYQNQTGPQPSRYWKNPVVNKEVNNDVI